MVTFRTSDGFEFTANWTLTDKGLRRGYNNFSKPAFTFTQPIKNGDYTKWFGMFLRLYSAGNMQRKDWLASAGMESNYWAQFFQCLNETNLAINNNGVYELSEIGKEYVFRVVSGKLNDFEPLN